MRLSALIAAAGILLSGCASAAGQQSFTDFAKQIASDPRCAHTDRVQGNLGGIGGNNLAVFLERTCPPQTLPATATSPAIPPRTGP